MERSPMTRVESEASRGDLLVALSKYAADTQIEKQQKYTTYKN
jgi:hypothetical protein